MNDKDLVSQSIFIPDDIKTLLKDLDNNNPDYNVYLVGGYLRDSFTNNVAKDVDVVFTPKERYVTPSVNYVPVGGYVNYRLESREMSLDLQSRGVSEVTGLFFGKLSTTDVQFIVYKEPLTHDQVCEDMDINICQIAYSANDDKISYTNAFWKGHNNKVIECMINYDEERTFYRYERMKKKFPEYTVIGQPEGYDPLSKPNRDRHAGSMISLEE